MKEYDVVGLGELLIDFTYYGKSENGNSLFEQNPGGAPPNLMGAVQRLGGTTAFIGKVGDDIHGHHLKKVLDDVGISTKGLVIQSDVFTTLAFVDLAPNGERTFSFARKPGSDTQLTPDEVDYELIKSAKVFHIGSLSLTDEPARSATFEAIKFAKENGCIVSYDPNYREPLWKDRETAIKGMRSILEMVDIIKVSDEEIELLTDQTTPEAAAKVFFEKGISCVIVTLGGKGAYVATKDISVTSPCRNVRVVDTTGAGDSFFGGFLYKMTQDNKNPGELTYKDLGEYARFANGVASIVVTRRGALNSMPTMAEVKKVL